MGDWGGASEHIGRQWERLGAPSLASLVGQPRPGPDGETYVPRQVVSIAGDPQLAAQVQAMGRSHADALLIGTLNGDVILEPVDFKWTLETADPKQVSVAVLETLLTDPAPLLERAIADAVREVSQDPGLEPRLHAGIFLAPDSVANRAHLAPRGPMDPVWAALVPVDWGSFFPPLPGWSMAQRLAELERTRLQTLELAERFYRLGAGVRGALRKLEAGIFDQEPADFDDRAALDWLQRERKIRTVGEIVSYLDRALTARSELVQKLRETERAAYPFGRFAADLKSIGVDTTGEDRRWRPYYGAVMKQLGARIRAAGLEQVRAGRTELEALTELANRKAEWLPVARQMLQQSLRTADSV